MMLIAKIVSFCCLALHKRDYCTSRGGFNGDVGQNMTQKCVEFINGRLSHDEAVYRVRLRLSALEKP